MNLNRVFARQLTCELMLVSNSPIRKLKTNKNNLKKYIPILFDSKIINLVIYTLFKHGYSKDHGSLVL